MLVVLCRTVILFVLIIISMRILGKRQLGEMEPSEFVIALLISDIAAVPIEDNGTPLMYGVVPMFALISLELLITFGVMKNLRFRVLLCGKPSIVVQNGKIIQKELLRSRITVDELIEELRGKDVTDISKVKYAILETSGELNVILYADHKPATVSDINIKVEDTGLPVAIISDGKVLRNNLKIRNIDESWVEKYLRKRKMPGPDGIFLMTIDDQGNIYISEKEHNR
jgi:uncharacterized membrane protein YcaP (DUF421 family)